MRFDFLWGSFTFDKPAAVWRAVWRGEGMGGGGGGDARGVRPCREMGGKVDGLGLEFEVVDGAFDVGEGEVEVEGFKDGFLGVFFLYFLLY